MTCEQFLKQLTPQQRLAFERLKEGRVPAPAGAPSRRPYENLAKIGLAERHYCAMGLTFVLTNFGRICSGPIAMSMTSSSR